MLTYDELRPFLARLLGWRSEEAIDHALRSIDLAASYRAHLVLQGVGDLVPIARTLHRKVLGADKPFIVCDPRRGNARASVRSPENHESGVRALLAAIGGSLCVRYSRLPRDFWAIVPRLRETANVRYIVCANSDKNTNPLLVVPAPIHVPQLEDRVHELERIVDEYALDAMVELRAHEACFTASDRRWVLEHVTTLAEIEKATLRMVALRTSRNLSEAAARLGMAPVSLSRWISRRSPTTSLSVS